MTRFGLKFTAFSIAFSLLFINSANSALSNDPEQMVMVQKMVDEAVELINTKGQEGVDAIADKNGKFNTKDSYVFVTSETGADLINPAFKDIEGMPLETYSLDSSKDAQVAIVNAVKDKDSAWVEYSWPKPGEDKPSRKIAYLRKIVVNDRVRIVGAGFYPEG